MSRTQHRLETRADTQAQTGFSFTDTSSLFSFTPRSPRLNIFLHVTKWMGFTVSGRLAHPLRALEMLPSSCKPHTACVDLRPRLSCKSNGDAERS